MKPPRPERGCLFVFEGIDGTGKTTQARRLVETLSGAGYKASYHREPSDSRWGRIIREKAVREGSLTPEEELALFQNDRRENVRLNLEPALERGEMVVLDRYYFSTMAYQGAKGLSPDKIQADNEAFAVPPDLVFIFDIDPAEGLRRIAGRGVRDALFEREDYLEKVRAIFLGLKGDRFIRIDASRPVDDVAARIEEAVFAHLEAEGLAIPGDGA